VDGRAKPGQDDPKGVAFRVPELKRDAVALASPKLQNAKDGISAANRISIIFN
jgi:hypothetical protein